MKKKPAIILTIIAIVAFLCCFLLLYFLSPVKTTSQQDSEFEAYENIAKKIYHVYDGEESLTITIDKGSIIITSPHNIKLLAKVENNELTFNRTYASAIYYVIECLECGFLFTLLVLVLVAISPLGKYFASNQNEEEVIPDNTD